MRVTTMASRFLRAESRRLARGCRQSFYHSLLSLQLQLRNSGYTALILHAFCSTFTADKTHVRYCRRSTAAQTHQGEPSIVAPRQTSVNSYRSNSAPASRCPTSAAQAQNNRGDDRRKASAWQQTSRARLP